MNIPESHGEQPIKLPVLLLRDVVIYPYMILPLFVGRKKSITALEAAVAGDKKIFLVAQKKPSDDMPSAKDVYEVGAISNILQLLKLPDGNVKVLVEGIQRAKIVSFPASEAEIMIGVSLMVDVAADKAETEGLNRTMLSLFEQYVRNNKKIPPEILTTLRGIEDPGRLADTIAAYLTIKLPDKQAILEETSVQKRSERLMTFVQSEIDLMQVEKRVRGRVKRQMERSQREYFLSEQMKAIQKELGGAHDVTNEIDELQKRIKVAGMSPEARKKAEAEVNKLRQMPAMSSEATVVRNYIDWLLNVPWKSRTKVYHDIVKAEEVLEKDHYGLEKVKQRIVEYLAVQQRVKKLKGPLLCLVGPPGVGKTSLGESIARATHRRFVRMSLGGMRDEAEIRGHRRTYIGSLPGRIVQKLAKVQVKNPLFMLDEVDKIAQDYRGDPASALLEVLDPEQNHSFNDHYLEVDYDLSEVMFIATANTINTIPMPLLDRMEVIYLSGYTEDEKANIALRYLMPKAITNNGLKESEIQITKNAIIDIIRYYTREAGVRNLEREISKICRKVVKEILKKGKQGKTIVQAVSLEKYLGVRRYRFGTVEQANRIGQVTGLAWTEVGGDLLTVEAAAVPGKGKLTYTGQLGEVMRESIKAALTVVRTRSTSLNIEADFHEKHDVHVHVPEGAIPKDGPSAGIAMCTALASIFTEVPVRADIAMTGEITLRGEVLPIGGLREKLLAARRGGIHTVIIPKENEKDLKEIPKIVTKDLKIHTVQWIDEVLALALLDVPRRKLSAIKKPSEKCPSIPLGLRKKRKPPRLRAH
ncbi:MAG: endopeptidase La [Gammaproteobacteria bacterium]|nr:endopeptidase La [Gammaproteobacteria bacterium]